MGSAFHLVGVMVSRTIRNGLAALHNCGRRIYKALYTLQDAWILSLTKPWQTLEGMGCGEMYLPNEGREVKAWGNRVRPCIVGGMDHQNHNNRTSGYASMKAGPILGIAGTW